MDYCIVNSDGIVINRLRYERKVDMTTHPCYPDHQMIEATGPEQIGWSYSNGKYSAPPVHPCLFPEPEGLFKKVKTQEQKDIDDIKTDIKTLTQSLTQVITALNALTQSKVAVPNV